MYLHCKNPSIVFLTLHLKHKENLQNVLILEVKYTKEYVLLKGIQDINYIYVQAYFVFLQLK